MPRGKTLLLAGGATLNSATFTGQSLFADGSQTAPSISFTSDPDTGIFWNSSGDFRFTSNGSAIFAFQSAVFTPTSDASVALGGAATRWSTVFTKALNVSTSLANPNMGIVTLSGAAGSAIAYTTALTASTRIYLTHQNATGTPGIARVTASTNAVGFTITSSSTTDTSVIAWLLVQSS